MATVLDTALKEINSLRNAGFSDGIDQEVPLKSPCKRWVMYAPTKVFIGQLAHVAELTPWPTTLEQIVCQARSCRQNASANAATRPVDFSPSTGQRCMTSNAQLPWSMALQRQPATHHAWRPTCRSATASRLP